jgi:hypothetical protein
MDALADALALYERDHHAHDVFALQPDGGPVPEGERRGLHPDDALGRHGHGHLSLGQQVLLQQPRADVAGTVEHLEEFQDEGIALHPKQPVALLGKLDPPFELQKLGAGGFHGVLYRHLAPSRQATAGGAFLSLLYAG